MTQYAVEYSPFHSYSKCGPFPLHVKVGAIIVLHSQKIKVHRYVHMDAMVFFLADAVKWRCTTDKIMCYMCWLSLFFPSLIGFHRMPLYAFSTHPYRDMQAWPLFLKN